MPRYIGASLTAVRRAIRQDKFRFAIQKRGRMIDVRGAGTTRLSRWLERKLVKRWWDAGPGTKLVIGWVHSKSIWYYNNRNSGHPPPTNYKIMTAAVTRPARMISQDEDEPLLVFRRVLENSMLKRDRRLRRLFDSIHDAGLVPVFYGNNRIRYGISYVFVWPAGIVDDPRVSNGLNKLHNAYTTNTRRRSSDYEKYRLGWGPETEPEALQWAHNVVDRAVRRQKKLKTRQLLAKALHRTTIPVDIRRKINAAYMQQGV